MIFILMILFAIVFVTAQISSQEEFNKDYISKNNTQCIKGFFVILVLFSHYAQYVTLDSVWDAPYVALRGHLNQMVVVPFLFYSGYGIMVSIQKKGKLYVRSIMQKRFPKVWFDFCVAVTCFLVVNLILDRVYPLKRVLLAYTGWESIGNSNWYILGVLILYILTYLAFNFIPTKLIKNFEIIGCILLTVFTMAVVLIFMKAGRPDYYYNTLFLYPVGCWYAVFQKKIDQLFQKNDFIYLVIFTAVVSGYCLSFIKRWDYGIEGYTIWAITFMAVLLMITMKVSFRSRILSWYGNHVFSIYILQRIPMMILSRTGLAAEHKYMFFILSFLMTTVVAIVFEKIVGELYSFLQNVSEKNKFN